MPSSRARLPPDLGVPARFSKYYDNIYPRTLLRDRLTGKKDWEKGRACLHQHPRDESRVISRYRAIFLSSFSGCGNRETAVTIIYIYIYMIGEKMVISAGLQLLLYTFSGFTPTRKIAVQMFQLPSNM